MPPKNAQCPVCPNAPLGLRYKNQPTILWCHDCNWCYRFENNKKPLPEHKGKLNWRDKRVNGDYS